jgi:hypothetical protein
MLAMSTGTATTITALFAAVAAVAAWATVTTEWLRQRKARQPNLSAGFLDIRATGAQKIEFVNAGPGLAIQLGYAIYANGLRHGGIVGTGHLQAGERHTLDVPIEVTEKTAEFVWACRDIDQRLHVWSYAGEHKRLKKGEYPNMGECFALMYPQTALPPRNIGVADDPTAPGN